MKHNVMGSETATVTIALTDKEKEEFLNSLWRKYDNTNHTWDMDGNELTVSWCEDGFWAEKYDVYSWEEEIKCFDDIKTGCACFAEDSNPVLLGSFGTLKEAQEFLSENETEISKVGHLWMVKEFWIDKDQRDQLGDPADTVERCVAITDTDGAVKDFE